MLPLKLVLRMLEISLDSLGAHVAIDPDVPIHSRPAKVFFINHPNK
jgi:hypothetical protein